MELHLTLNGTKKTIEVAPNAVLLDVLREAGMKSVKKGCGEGSCGACAVLIDGRVRTSCLTFAGSAEGSEVLTVEGLGTYEHPHQLQRSFVDHGATQCGYCNPGSLIAAKALLDRVPNPSEAEVREALDGNLCRCTGYVKRIEAILDAAKILAGQAPARATPARAAAAAAKAATKVTAKATKTVSKKVTRKAAPAAKAQTAGFAKKRTGR